MDVKASISGSAKPATPQEEMLKVLLNVSQSLYQHIDIDDLISHIIHQIRELLDVEAASVILHDQRKNEFIFRWLEDERVRDKTESELKALRFPVDKGVAGSVFSTGKPELIHSIETDSRHFKAIDDLTQCKTESMIAVPLSKKGRVIGVLEALNKKSGRFGDEDLALLSTVAPIMAMALDNARLYAELQEAYTDLQIEDQNKDLLIKNAQEENARLRQAIEKRYRFDRLVGNSDCMLDLFRLCEKIMESEITILIEGETGTGKELLARCLHYNSPRKNKPFISQNCGGIPETLLTSELFGHKRGAFTGAVSDKKGVFELAGGGTIFLDEVAEMSPAMQTTLLRVLQEREIKPVGAEFFKKVDVRVISATNRGLEDLVKKKEFREDLYYRLHVFNLKLPPLRERTGDIPILASHFIEKYNKKYGKSVNGVHPAAMACLEAYPFPGNVRELENEMERAVLMADAGKSIRIPHLSPRLRSRFQNEADSPEGEGTLKEMVESLEKSVLTKILEKHQGNKSRAAKMLGLSRYGLIKKIRRYDLEF